MGWGGTAVAQTAPEAGDLLRQERDLVPAPRMRPEITIEGQRLETLEPGGGRVQIQELLLSGTNALSDDDLYAAIGDYRGREYDLAGLQELANTISRYYRERGYPFAQAYLPAQDVFSGIVRIDVLEGRYGAVTVSDVDGGEPPAGVDAFLKPLAEGRVIKSDRLERAALLLDEQPGYEAIPVIRPGNRLGTGDLDVQIAREDRLVGSLGFDNHGNTYSGQWRGRASVNARRNLVFGDQFSLSALYTEEDTRLADFAYGFPVGGNGLRARVGYTRSEYELGEGFDGFYGKSRTGFLELPYALYRSQPLNLTLRPRFQYNDLTDNAPNGTATTKDSDVYSLDLEFDRRDGFAGGGIFYGRFGADYGHVNGDVEVADNTFILYRVNLTRLQNMPLGLQAMVRVVAQQTSDNLDGFQSITLGGANAVRAYPQGEASGNNGYYAQFELRYAIGQSGLAPYLFYDYGDSEPYGGNVPAGQNNDKRTISGGGAGLRFNRDRFSLTAAAAWRDQGGAPQSSNDNDDPQAWITGSIRF